MTDFASIGIQLDSRPVAEGTKALDALSEASVRVEQKVKASNGQMADTAKIMAAQAEQAKVSAAANMALGGSTAQLTLGQQQLIEKYREQAATIGMSRSQLMAYQAAQMGVTSETEKAIATVKAHEEAIKAAAKAKEEETRSSNQLASALKLLASGYAALKIGEYVKDSAMLAARYETLGVVLEVVGRNAGYTKTQMDAAADGIARQGITMLESRNSAVKLVQAHVDLSNATRLARIAQDAAVIGNINSSEAFDRLVNGISRGNVLILRNIGINVNLQSSYEQMAESLGKTARELTENERVQARLNAVLERGTDIAGTYESAMGTAGKQILSMQRYTQDLKVKFGETFNEALTIAVMALTDNLKDTNHEVSELARNNQLSEWGHSLTNIFVTLANTVSNAFTTFQKFDAFARHMDSAKAINSDFDAKIKANSDAAPGGFDAAAQAERTKIFQRNQRLESLRQSALAQENVDYVTLQATLSGNFDRFARAAAEREATMTAKHKAEADAKLKVDQDYATKAAALLTENAGKSLAIQQAAQMKLYRDTYVGTPTYRDTEGRAPKDHIDQAENTRLADHIKRIEAGVASEKAAAEYMMRIDEMRHKAGILGDAEFYERRKGYADEMVGSEIAGYNKEIAALRAHHNNTAAEAATNAKTIHDTQDKLAAAKEKYRYEDLTRDEEERLRIRAVSIASDEANNKYISGLDAQAKAIDIANGKHQQAASAIAEEAAAQFRLAAAAMAAQAAAPVSGDHTQGDVDAAKAMLITLNLQADAQERIARALRDGEAAVASRKLADQQIRDWQEVGNTVADSLSKAFGAAGKAAGEMFKAYADNASKQLKLNKELALAKKLSDDDPAKIKAIDDIQRQSAQAQLKSYGDMADAAQGFFDQGSKGYAAMGTAAKVMHAAEVALSLVKGVNAVLTQGEGDPYTAFARMAAMAAVVTGLGVALSGGGGSGGGQSAAEVQKAQGTGSVFGDSTAKSDSIARSIALASANSSIELTHTAGMLASLKSIEASMSGLTNLVVRTPGATDASNMGIQTGTIAKSLGGLWGKTTQNVVDSGFQFGGSVRGLQAGQGFNQYASVDTTKSSWFGLSKSTSNSVQMQGIGNELSSQFGLIFTNLETSLKTAAVGLGGSADQVGSALDHLTLSTSKISLKGLTGDALTAAINGVISKAMDEMAEAAMPGFDRFRKVGEGYAETVTRVSTDFQNVGSIFDSMGKSLVVTANTTSNGLATSIGGWLGRLTQGIVNGVASSLPKVSTLSIDARERLVELAGGIDKLASQANTFASNYLTEAERLAPVTKYVTEQMRALGYAGINTRDQFKSLVLGLDVSTQKGAEQYTALMGLADAFAKTHAATVDLTKSTQEVADERKGLQDQLDQLTMTQTQLLTKQRNALDAANRPLFDMVQAAQKLAGTSSDMAKFRDTAKSLHDSLLTGSLSTLTPEQQYAEQRRQYEQTKAAALGGDVTAQGNVAAALNSFLAISQKINGSDSQYAADFAMAQQDSASMAQWAAGQVDTAQAQLAAMNTTNSLLTDISQGITNLNAPINPSNYGGTDGMPVLVAQVKEMTATIVDLKTELAGLRADQNKQTGNSIVANDESQQANADAIVGGLGGVIIRAIGRAQKVDLE
ncbi:MAG TPA: hypothetical protein VFW00_07070 [Rhodocyclaceae bacterium]|nr:hypothetical protein [Rhodocyclaceae bacterium]